MKPVRDADARRAWSAIHDRCQICGKTDDQSRHENGGVGLQTHHIIRLQGSSDLLNLAKRLEA